MDVDGGYLSAPRCMCLGGKQHNACVCVTHVCVYVTLHVLAQLTKCSVLH